MFRLKLDYPAGALGPNDHSERQTLSEVLQQVRIAVGSSANTAGPVMHGAVEIGSWEYRPAQTEKPISHQQPARRRRP